MHDGSFHQILDSYWTRVLPQVPDTLLNSADRLIARAAGNDEMFKYITHYITFNSESSQVMCMDKIFVHMIDTYYATGQATWMNEEQLKKVMDRAEELRDSQCGSIIPNIILPGLDQETWMSLYDIEAKYTAVLIWESTCGHCKKELPKYKELYKEWHPKGLEIYAIGNDFEPEPWQEFVEEQEYTDWINVSDNPLINAQDSASALIYGGVTTLKSLNFAPPSMCLLRRRFSYWTRTKRSSASKSGLNRWATSSAVSRKWNAKAFPIECAQFERMKKARMSGPSFCLVKLV